MGVALSHPKKIVPSCWILWSGCFWWFLHGKWRKMGHILLQCLYFGRSESRSRHLPNSKNSSVFPPSSPLTSTPSTSISLIGSEMDLMEKHPTQTASPTLQIPEDSVDFFSPKESWDFGCWIFLMLFIHRLKKAKSVLGSQKTSPAANKS